MSKLNCSRRLSIQKRFILNRPKLLTIDGNLIIESGLNKNITFRTSGSGAVLLNNVNLMRPQTVNNGSAFLGSYNLMVGFSASKKNYASCQCCSSFLIVRTLRNSPFEIFYWSINIHAYYLICLSTILFTDYL